MPNYKKIFVMVLSKHHNHKKWEEGDYVGIKKLSNTKVGSVGQDFIEGLCNDLDITIEFPEVADKKKGKKRATQSPWDIKINGVEFELKTATEDVGGSFQFNHIRLHRPYDAVMCLGVSPNDLYFNIWSKADIVTNKAGTLVSMEAKANASYKLTKKPKDLKPIKEFEEVLLIFTKDFK